MDNEPQQKVSRYRSQRQRAQQEQQQRAEAEQQAQVEDAIARSKSRYHRKVSAAKPATAQNQEYANGAIDDSPNAQTRQHSGSRSSSNQNAAPVATHSPSQRYRHNAYANGRRQMSPQSQPGAADSRIPLDEQNSLDRMRSPPTSSKSPHRPEPVPASALAYGSIPHSSPTGELFPPPKPPPEKPPRMDGPPTSHQIRATQSVTELQKYDDDETGGGCFGLFKRKRGEGSQSQEKRPPIARAPTSSSGEPRDILAGGGGIVPGTDAPISAVNAGDRRVLVECGRSQMAFPVTPTTTPVDLIKSASITMSERIDVKSAVVLENFGTVGVQRPLRRYEHIRDVMNSWDNDTQNSLLLVDPGTGNSEFELSLAGAPQAKPVERSWFLSYSQKVGKWEKRFIVLKTDGQVTCQRDPNKLKDVINVCHLSDFDIYTPTQEKIKKKVKPPKKYCFAIKSQQKTSMFESTQNFVHFLCTNDKATADDFYRGIQSWRSWYLVNVMGEGKRTKPAVENKPDAKEVGGISTGFTAQSQNHRKMDSMESHYQLGSFRPLIDTDQFDKRPGSSGGRPGSRSGSGSGSGGLPERHASNAQRRQHPPVSLDKRAQLAEDEPLANIGRRASVDRRPISRDAGRQGAEEFASSGLLGRSYSQRQRDLSERETQRNDQPFTSGPNLLNGETDLPIHGSSDLRRNLSTRHNNADNTSDLRRGPSVREHHRGGSVDLQRSGSTRVKEMPKPLIDLTPQYREPPQHIKKGRAHRPEQGGPLVEAATSPEDPLGVPSSIDWRGRNNSTANPATMPTQNRTRSASRTGEPVQKSSVVHRSQTTTSRPTTARPSTARAQNSDPAFTGEGLLAQSQQGWGGGSKGRGVMDGSHTKGPMLDMTEQSVFAQGSLLKKMESR